MVQQNELAGMIGSDEVLVEPTHRPEQTATIDVNNAVLLIRRLGKRREATADALLAALLVLLKSDTLHREAVAAQVETLMNMRVRG